MAATKKHFRDAASMVHAMREADLQNVAEAILYVESYFVGLFESENPRFDEGRFLQWCRTGTDNGDK